MIACLMLGTTFLKSFNVASSYYDETHRKSFSLYWILKMLLYLDPKVELRL